MVLFQQQRLVSVGVRYQPLNDSTVDAKEVCTSRTVVVVTHSLLRLVETRPLTLPLLGRYIVVVVIVVVVTGYEVRLWQCISPVFG